MGYGMGKRSTICTTAYYKNELFRKLHIQFKSDAKIDMNIME